MRAALAVALLLGPAFAGCLAASDDGLDASAADGASGDVPTLPEGLQMDGAEVVSYNETSVVWRWSATTGPGALGTLTGTATGTTTSFDVPADRALFLQATLAWEDPDADLDLEILADDGGVWCFSTGGSPSEPNEGEEGCGGPLPRSAEPAEWTVRVTPFTSQQPEQPFEVTLRLAILPDEPTGVDASVRSGCDTPLLDERIRMREIDAATDPDDPDNLAVAMIATPPPFRDDPPNDWQMWDGLARSEDGGRTWEFAMLPGWPGDTESEPGPFHGAELLSDPIVLFLDDGTLLYSGLMVREYSVQLFVSRFAPGEMTPESTAVLARGALSTQGPLHQVPTPYGVVFNEKQKFTQDPGTGDVYIAWEWYTGTGVGATPLIARSTDGGRTWGDPVDIMGPESRAERASEAHSFPYPFVTDDGRVHAVWFERDGGTLYQATSSDQAATFEAPRELLDTTGVYFPSVGVDHTGGPHDGTVYVAWGSEDAGPGDADIWLIKSTDAGTSWSEPILVAEDLNKPPALGPWTTLTVEPDGAVSVLFDGRGEAGGASYQVAVARSTDGGDTWAVTKLAGEATHPARVQNEPGQGEYPLFPLSRTRVGDYNGLTWTENGLLAVWQDGREGTSEVPYSTAWMCLLETRGDGA